MKSKWLFLMFTVTLIGSVAFAAETQMASGAASTAAEEVGNQICPISGKKIVQGKEAKIAYNGKVYNLCCKMCEKDFSKDPQKYIDALEKKMKEATTEVK